MKPKAKNGSGLHAYLESLGVLSGTHEDIQAARKAYWKKRKRELAQDKREREHSFIVWLTDIQLRSVAEAAHDYGVSRTAFIKRSALSVAEKKRYVVNSVLVAELTTLLRLNYTALERVFDTCTLPEDVGIAVIERIEYLEQEILRIASQNKSSAE